MGKTNFKTINIENIKYIFDSCLQLKPIEFDKTNFQIINVKIIEAMLY